MISAQEAFDSRKPEDTLGMYDALIRRGPVGQVAFGLFRAQKRSSLAKGYRRGRWRNDAYDGKGEALKYLNAALCQHGAFRWGWAMDPVAVFHNRVLYVETPHGQVSFHSASDYRGPVYEGAWDGARDVAVQRVVAFCDDVVSLPQDESREWLLVPFGKHVGRLATDLEAEYLEWLAAWSGLNSWPTLRAFVHTNVFGEVFGHSVQKPPSPEDAA